MRHADHDLPIIELFGHIDEMSHGGDGTIATFHPEPFAGAELVFQILGETERLSQSLKYLKLMFLFNLPIRLVFYSRD